MNNRHIKYNFFRVFVLILSISIIAGCATRRKKGETSKLGKLYHNMTSEFNGYFNANEIMKESYAILQESNQDNYSKILEPYNFTATPDPKVVSPQLDKAIEKVARVAALHQPGDWVDDCYVLMGQAQFLKKDFETSLETLTFFENEYNPANPYGRNYKKKKASAKARKEEQVNRKKELANDRKVKDKTREEAKKIADKEREEDKKAREEAAKDRKSNSRTSTRSSTRTSSRTSSRARGTTPVKEEPKVTPVIPAIAADSSKQVVAVVETKKPAVKPEKPKREKADKSAYWEGILWLAMGYTKTQQYSSAEYILKRLNEMDGLDKKVQRGILPAMVEVAIKQKDYDVALEYLEQAIENPASKELKARYAFIAGQLLQERRDYRNAINYFELARKNAGSNFKMKFMAELFKIKSGAMNGGRSESEVAGELEKMLSQDKNKLFKDQIYFALGEIALDKENLPKAKEYFTKSIANNQGDNALKSEAYFYIANMYYNVKDYVKAKDYYDSTALTLVLGDPRLESINQKSKQLTTVAQNLSTLTRLDSIMRMADMTKDQLYAIAVERQKQEQTLGKPLEAPKNTSALYTGNFRPASQSSSFFAYNAISLENGIKDFQQAWGNRDLVDKWRNNRRSGTLTSNDETATNGDSNKNKLSDEDYNRLMADVPKDDLDKQKYKAQIGSALFDLGKSLKLDLEDYTESVKYLERLVNQYPDFQNRLDALYFLYLNYSDLRQIADANKIKQTILSEFPESNYAKILLDPSYSDELIASSNKLENFYKETYSRFLNKSYKETMERSRSASDLFGSDNKLMPKFSLLKAMSTGSLEGREAYIQALQETIVRYPGTEEETKAQEILRFLKGDDAAFNAPDIKEVDNLFVKEDNVRHYVAVVIFNYGDDVLQKSKLAISNYNTEYNSNDNLGIGDAMLSKEEATQVILIRSFDNLSRATSYYNGIKLSPERFIPSIVTAYEYYPISQANYRKMIQQRTHSGYRAFYKSNY